jgi:surface polysaccharide O-acyltransferase-like enzyme
MNKKPRIPAIEFARVLAMFLVMTIHTPTGDDPSQPTSAFMVRGFLACGAVPLFFILSGYFAAKKIAEPSVSIKFYAKDKWHSLMFPFLLWNGVTLFFVFVLKATPISSILRGTGAYFNVEPTFQSILAAIFGIGRYPIVYQFWFLRDLIIVSFASFIILRIIPKIPLLPWFFFLIPNQISYSMGYFLIGHGLSAILNPSTFPNRSACFVFIILWLCAGLSAYYGLINIPEPILSIGSASFILLLAITATPSPISSWVIFCAPAVMFVYATHEPLQSIFSKIFQIWGLDGRVADYAYILIPMLAFPICTATYFSMRKVAPNLTRIFCGGR